MMQDKQPKRFLQCKTVHCFSHSVVVSTHNETSSRTNSVFCHPRALVGVFVHRNVGIVYCQFKGKGRRRIQAKRPNGQSLSRFP